MVVIAKLIGETTVFVSNDWICMPIVFVATCAICSVLAVYIGKLKRLDEQWMNKKRLTM